MIRLMLACFPALLHCRQACLAQLDWKDCEKVIKKNNINGQRFLNMSENDIQKFPTLRVPQIHQLCQEINKKEGIKSFFQKRNQNPIIQESSDYRHNDDIGWDSDEFTEDDDDYEDPDEDQSSGDDDGDYESPNEDGEGHNSDSDYEPPPSNDEEAHQSKIFAAKPISNDSDYADKRTTIKSGSHPPIPPQRPGSIPIMPAGNKGNIPSMFSNIPVSDDPGHNKDRGFSTPGYRAPKVDRSRKPLLDQPGSQQVERDSPSMVKKSPFPDKHPMSLPRPPFGSRPDPSCRMPKPTVPVDRGNPSLGRRQTSPRPYLSDKIPEEEDDGFSSRSFPRPVDSALNANTFPYRASRPGPKPSFSGGNQLPLPHADSGSLPPRFQQEAKPSSPRAPSDSRPPHPLPSNKVRPALTTPQEESLSREWYAGCINRSEAESALRSINKDGTFLVRNSSRRNSEHPFVLMVLYRDKVYNIQIRYQEDIAMYLLGTGLRGKENFNSVTELVEYHTQTSLMLIDGKDQRGGQRNQCTLIYPAAQ
ncbi:lymphocyte cytosolic protein 2a isoform X2 [Narcine bancroftii]|uniref:lymphocyte cytosolic protein 2a isoform X2 n=1 Tax=Narcine bancroftii TaxID=1343680 RepID=UPI003831E93D